MVTWHWIYGLGYMKITHCIFTHESWHKNGKEICCTMQKSLLCTMQKPSGSINVRVAFPHNQNKHFDEAYLLITITPEFYISMGWILARIILNSCLPAGSRVGNQHWAAVWCQANLLHRYTCNSQSATIYKQSTKSCNNCTFLRIHVFD